MIAVIDTNRLTKLDSGLMDSFLLTESDCSDEDFAGFNSDDIQVATDRLAGQHDISESESDLEITTDADSDSESERETDDEDTSDLSSGDDVPNLGEHPVQWTENFQQFNVPPFTRASGPNLPANWDYHSSPRQYFQLFFTDELLHNIVRFTNDYARLWILRKRTTQPNYEDKEWAFDGSDNITYDELCAYLGCNIIMSVNPYRQLKHVFSSDPYLGNSGIRNVFTLKRFTKIGHYFCVSDKSVEPPRDSDSYDKLYKIRPVIEQLNHLFPKYYKYTSHMALDESSVKTQSRDGMKMFMKNKPAKFGFRLWSICASLTPERPYLFRFEPYLGKKLTKVSRHGLYFDVVNRLTHNMRGSNARIFTDSAYSSCKLFLFLQKHKIFATGTVRHNSKGLHPYVKSPPKNMVRGDFKIFQNAENRNLTCCVWKDTKAVRFISTQCDPRIRCSALRRISGEYHRIHQPLIASNYSSHYKAVDQFDFLATKYCIARRSYRPWLYLYNFCTQAAIVNSYILYMQTNSEQKPKNFTQSDFRLLLGKQLISGYTCRKVQPIYQPLFVGPDITTENLVNHENCKIATARGRTCRYHKQKWGNSKRTIFGCNACRVFLCKECHYPWHQSIQN